MAVALMAVTQGPSEMKQEGASSEETINSLHDRYCKSLTRTDEFKGVTIRGYSIDFGTLAEFKNDDHRLDPGQERFIRAFVPRVLQVARNMMPASNG